jgi:hypothetical protein
LLFLNLSSIEFYYSPESRGRPTDSIEHSAIMTASAMMERVGSSYDAVGTIEVEDVPISKRGSSSRRLLTRVAHCLLLSLGILSIIAALSRGWLHVQKRQEDGKLFLPPSSPPSTLPSSPPSTLPSTPPSTPPSSPPQLAWCKENNASQWTAVAVAAQRFFQSGMAISQLPDCPALEGSSRWCMLSASTLASQGGRTRSVKLSEIPSAPPGKWIFLSAADRLVVKISSLCKWNSELNEEAEILSQMCLTDESLAGRIPFTSQPFDVHVTATEAEALRGGKHEDCRSQAHSAIAQQYIGPDVLLASSGPCHVGRGRCNETSDQLMFRVRDSAFYQRSLLHGSALHDAITGTVRRSAAVAAASDWLRWSKFFGGVGRRFPVDDLQFMQTPEGSVWIVDTRRAPLVASSSAAAATATAAAIFARQSDTKFGPLQRPSEHGMSGTDGASTFSIEWGGPGGWVSQLYSAQLLSFALAAILVAEGAHEALRDSLCEASCDLGCAWREVPDAARAAIVASGSETGAEIAQQIDARSPGYRGATTRLRSCACRTFATRASVVGSECLAGMDGCLVDEMIVLCKRAELMHADVRLSRMAQVRKTGTSHGGKEQQHELSSYTREYQCKIPPEYCPDILTICSRMPGCMEGRNESLLGGEGNWMRRFYGDLIAE